MLSNRRKKLLGTRFACKYGIEYNPVLFFGKQFAAKTEKEFNNALYIRFCIDSFADKEFPKAIYKKLWDLNEEHFGLPPEIVYNTYKELAVSLCKQDPKCEFRDWDYPVSELHMCCEAHIHGILNRKKKEHWRDTKEEIHWQLYNRPLVEG